MLKKGNGLKTSEIHRRCLWIMKGVLLLFTSASTCTMYIRSQESLNLFQACAFTTTLIFCCCTVEYFFKFNFFKAINTISSSGIVKKDPNLCLSWGILTKGFETGDYSLDLLAGINDSGEDYGAGSVYKKNLISYLMRKNKEIREEGRDWAAVEINRKCNTKRKVWMEQIQMAEITAE